MILKGSIWLCLEKAFKQIYKQMIVCILYARCGVKKMKKWFKKKLAEGDFAMMMLNLLKLQLHDTLDNNLFLYLYKGEAWMSLIGYFVLSKEIECHSLL